MNSYPSVGEEFVRLVEKMRDAQRKYFEKRQEKDLRESKRLELLVDSKIAQYKREILQFDLWAGREKTDELPGIYNAEVKE